MNLYVNRLYVLGIINTVIAVFFQNMKRQYCIDNLYMSTLLVFPLSVLLIMSGLVEELLPFLSYYLTN